MSRINTFCVAVSFILTSVFAAQRSLNSITDLIGCPLSEDTNVLELLYWFANQVDIDNRILLTFDPISEYGSHYFGNGENLLDSAPRGYKYYTVGNPYKDVLQSLPDYVRNPWRRNVNHTRARVIFRVHVGSNGPEIGQTIDQVYITQHPVDGGIHYDEGNTYRITTDLLLAIRQRDINDIQQHAIRFHRGNRHGSSHHLNEQSLKRPSTNHNGDSFLWMICKAILFIIIIFVLSFLGIMINIK